MERFHFFLLIGMMTLFSILEKWEGQQQTIDIIAACGGR